MLFTFMMVEVDEIFYIVMRPNVLDILGEISQQIKVDE